MAEKQGDVVYTPDWLARDMVNHFAPTGRILDPCRGKGAFADRMPGSDWCEITDGRDFFAWSEPVDWVIGNSPYSLTRRWLRHSYTLAEHVCYLLPLRNFVSGYGCIREAHDFGGIREFRLYGTGARCGFPMGNAIAAVHIHRGHTGPTLWSDQLSEREPPEFLDLWEATA